MDPDRRPPIRLEGDGLTLVADAYGPDDGPPVVLFHGGGQTRHAWGGTARLPRMVGVPVAARLILTGELLDPAEARDLGLVDRTFPVHAFEESVERFAMRRA